jgi:cyanophycinase-like exopeptidase
MTRGAGLLVIIGSGEMAAPMTRVHREVVRRLAANRPAAADLKAAIIDTPYGFQSNADALSEAALDFFGRRLGVSTAVASMRRSDDDLLARETAFARVREADFIFSGPGSPSYALRHWSGTPIPELLADKLTQGGALVFASAAALTLGRLTVPVYEIYKVGEDPFWLPGIDVLSQIGLSAAVIPHFDNTEGREHDTRFAFLGEERLAMLEEQMPDDVFILGVDEHTALMIDLDAEIVTVHGRGGVTVRQRGQSSILAAGEEIRFADIAHLTRVGSAVPPVAARAAQAPQSNEHADVRTLVRNILGGDDPALARSMVVQLGEMTERAVGERTRLVEPLVEALLEVRRSARARGDWATADAIRDRLLELGIELSDAPDGSTVFRVRRP